MSNEDRTSKEPKKTTAKERGTKNEPNISQSSWIYRLTINGKQQGMERNDVCANEVSKEEGKSIVDIEINTSETPADTTPIQPVESTTHTQSNIPTQNSRIWSWLGYSSDPSTDQTNESTIPVIESTVNEQTDDTQEPLRVDQSKIPYWKSYFTSNNSIDSMNPINSSNDQQSQICTKTNAVIPTFRSQFTEPYREQLTLFTKAMNIVNSIFTGQKSNFYDIDFSSMVDTMKKHPDDLDGKRFVVIGVHGWFPMKLVRSMLGEPTGTSARFCEQMSMALKKYFIDEHDLIIPDESITSIPLVREGKIMDRVGYLYEDIMSNWKDTIQSADVILWATHSQGTPVSAILLRRLMENEIIQVHRQPICMLAMAGISHGPFPTFKGNLFVKYFEADAARELFDFMDSESPISVQFREAMAFILENRVKTVLVASMQDQVVPLYSAIMSSIAHPGLLRAIYIDGHIYSKDDFLIRLISFALKLLNLGLSDHGFLIHISEVLAGNIYSWDGGHSSVYEELKVFMLPLHYLFETSPFGPCEIIKPKTLSVKDSEQVKMSDKNKQRAIEGVEARLDPFQAKARLNPFHLPWTIRGIWDDSRILGDDLLSKELEKLHLLFDQWNPTSTRLKEIKFRLEPLRARL